MHLLDNESGGHGSRPAAFTKASSVPKILAGHGLPPPSMDHLDELEAQSIYILREAFARLKKLALLWSLGKDSNVMIWLVSRPRTPLGSSRSQAIPSPPICLI